METEVCPLGKVAFPDAGGTSLIVTPEFVIAVWGVNPLDDGIEKNVKLFRPIRLGPRR